MELVPERSPTEVEWPGAPPYPRPWVLVAAVRCKSLISPVFDLVGKDFLYASNAMTSCTLFALLLAAADDPIKFYYCTAALFIIGESLVPPLAAY